MKKYEKKVIPAYTSEYVICRKCDLCGVESDSEEWEAESIYNVNETEVRVKVKQKEGYSCPDGGSGTEYEIDLCPKCFKEKLVPWLKSQGADIKEEKWNW